MTKDDIKEAVKEAMNEHHTCFLNSDDRMLIKDMVNGAKMFKLGVIGALVVGMLYICGKALLKGGGL